MLDPQNMPNKVFLFTGLVFILTGVVLKVLDFPRAMTMLFFVTGGGFKTVYLVKGFRSGQLAGRLYLTMLLFGLLLLFLSIILRNRLELHIPANVLLFTAISIKVFSIVGMKRTGRARQVARESTGANEQRNNC